MLSDHRQTLETLRNGFNKKHPHSANTFTLLQQMPLQMQQEAQGVLNRIAGL